MFGRPARTAAQDANEGKTDIGKGVAPSSAKMSGGANLTRPDLNSGGASRILSGVQGQVEEAGARRDAVKVEQALMNQGQSEAINEIDAENKRSSFSKLLFGQDKGYETAQRLAVQNSANADYQEMAVLSEHDANMTEQQYLDKLYNVRNERLTKFQEDPQAQAAYLDKWLPKQASLRREQAIRHAKYGAEQAHIEGVKSALGDMDTWQMEMKNSASNVSQMKANKEYKEFFSNPLVDPEASPEASKLIKFEAVTRSLHKGNLLPYEMMMEEGTFYESLSPAQGEMMTKAIGAYDNVRQADMVGITSAAETAALEGDVDGFSNGLRELALLKPRLSGTQQTENDWNKSKNAILRNQKKMNATVAKQEVEKQEAGLDAMAFAVGDAPMIADRQMTPKRQSAAADAWVMGTASSMNPAWDSTSNLSIEEVSEYLLDNEPYVVAGVAKRPMEEIGKGLELRGAKSPIVESLVGTVINGYARNASNVGQMNPERQSELQAVIGMKEVAPQLFKQSLDGDAYNTLAIIERGMGKDVKEIQADINAYNANKHLAGSLTASSMGLQTGQTKYDWLKQLVGNVQGAQPDDRSMQYYAEELDRGFMITQSVQGAREYVTTSIRDRNRNIDGKVVPNGKFLENAIDLGSNDGEAETLESIVTSLNNTPLMTTLIRSRIPESAQVNGQFTSLHQLAGVEYRANLSNMSLEVHAPQLSYPIVLTEDQLREAGQLAKEARFFKQNKAASIKQKALQQEQARWIGTLAYPKETTDE